MRIVMMGTGAFAEPTFEALLEQFGSSVVGLITQPDRDTGNKRGSTRQTGKGMVRIAELAIVPYAQPESINSPDGLAALRIMNPDLVVVAAYGQILSREVLTVPFFETINVHASLLPKYRGAAPVAHAILNGEKQTGVTIIRVTPGLDSGDMLRQQSLDILPDETAGELEARLAVIGAHLAVSVARGYKSGNSETGTPQNPALSTKAPKIKKEQGQIDWSKSAEAIGRHVRAMQPWPTAFTFLHRPGKEPIRALLRRVKPAARQSEGQTPGAIMADASAGERIEVAAGSGPMVEVLEVQIAGKKPMPASEFARGYAFPGASFGPEHTA